MREELPIICIAGPTASGKTSRAIAEALARGGEVISVDSRQVYRMLDIGTEKVRPEEMREVPHHLINIRDPRDAYSAGDFVADATRLIGEITAREKTPILVGGTHFYFDALFSGLPETTPPNLALRNALAAASSEELFARIKERDPRRAAELDPKNRRRIIRALEIVQARGFVPPREKATPQFTAKFFPARCNLGRGGAELKRTRRLSSRYPNNVPIGTLFGYLEDAGAIAHATHTATADAAVGAVVGTEVDAIGDTVADTAVATNDRGEISSARGARAVEWIVLNPPADELRARINARLKDALARGLIEEVERVRAHVGDARLNELGLEYRVVGEFLRGERDEALLLPALSAKLRQYARRQRAWLRKLSKTIIAEEGSVADKR